MEKNITLTLQVLANANSRKTSYSMKDMEAALRGIGLDPIRTGALFSATQTWTSRKMAVVARKHIEKAILRVHRNAAYRFVYIETLSKDL